MGDMAALTNQPKMKVKGGILDNWSTREKLALGCSVMRSGDQNWVSVSRAIKPYGEHHRPPDWFQPRNCATQYSNLLEKVETPKRKRGDRGEVEIPAKQIVVKLTIERIEELKKQVVESQQRYKKLKRDIDSLYSGQWDEQIGEKLEQAQNEKKAEDEAKKEEERKLKELYAARAVAQSQRSKGIRSTSGGSQSNVSEPDDSTQDSVGENIDVSALTDEENSQIAPSVPAISSTTVTSISTPVSETPTVRTNPPPSPLLSQLLKSRHNSPYSLTRIKQEQEQNLKQEQQQQQDQQSIAGTEYATDQADEQDTSIRDSSSADSDAPVIQQQPLPKEAEESEPEAVISVKIEVSQNEPLEPSTTMETEEKSSPEKDQELEVRAKQEIKDELVSQESAASSESTIDLKPGVASEIKGEETDDKDSEEPKLEQTTDGEVESQDEGESGIEASFNNVDSEISIKEEPASPASSVLSSVSDTRGRGSRGRDRFRGRMGQRVTRKSMAEKDDTSSKHSEAELTDDETGRESDEVLSHHTSQSTSVVMPAFSESVPDSPASVGIDTEDEKAYKTWKKSIMLVWRAAANHKNANVFLHPVTDDIAPGYGNVVLRPMDLATIKKNIESGALRTTAEFQRDIMLMFTNAIMYNSSNHNVYKMAKEMYDDVMKQIEQYVSTQLMVQSSETKVLRQSRRSDLPDKEEDSKKRRGSVEQAQEGGKTKKRKTRGDEV
ncbi:bromodomain-containing protein 8-like isoform X2 [Pomacea canaliculata]|uniref:bromodomain-containing protein 8-like isoform X2 n=1 Tax=Pomacea canaliculata TaxID=400727 RepID=UPI000D73CD73|nr:bromodomain-containing protein 8-like isoform X2 [Pomacea canaliculata]